MAIFNSYVCLPEGILPRLMLKGHVRGHSMIVKLNEFLASPRPKKVLPHPDT